MKAAVLTRPRQMEIRHVPTPKPSENQVLVRIKEAGICGTDYALYSGALTAKWPIIPGHEATGEVVALGPEVRGVSIGQRVAIQPNLFCGDCPMCVKGQENICLNKVRIGLDKDGVFAQFIALPEKNVWALPDDLPFSIGTLVEPLAVALHGIGRCRPSPGEKVLIYGAGVIGLLFVSLAALAEAWVTAYDIVDHRLRIAKELGAKATFWSPEDLEKERGSFSIIYETSGVPQAVSHVITLCAPAGRIVLTGLPEHQSAISASQIVRKELILQGSMIYRDEFRAAIDLLRRRKIKADLLISETFPLDRLPEAMEHFTSPHRIKTLIEIP